MASLCGSCYSSVSTTLTPPQRKRKQTLRTFLPKADFIEGLRSAAKGSSCSRQIQTENHRVVLTAFSLLLSGITPAPVCPHKQLGPKRHTAFNNISLLLEGHWAGVSREARPPAVRSLGSLRVCLLPDSSLWVLRSTTSFL